MALDANGLGRVLDGDGSRASTTAADSTKRPPNRSLFGLLGKNRKEVKRLREIIADFERETVTAIPAIERIMRERDAALELAAQLKIANESAASVGRLDELDLQSLDRDPLTNLLNRRGFEEAIFEKFGLGTPLLIVYVDVDGLKVTNDTYGHGVGDRLITEVCRRLEEKGEVVARVGGDELATALRAHLEPGCD